MSDGFLSRWARRKEAVKAAEQVPPAQVSAELTEPLQARVLSPLGVGVGVGVVQDEAGAVPSAPPPPSSPQGKKRRAVEAPYPRRPGASWPVRATYAV